jgi:ankyrin repeat protein
MRLLLLFFLFAQVANAAKPSAATAKLLEAAGNGDEDAILAAIAAGADVNARDADGNTPMILTAPQSLFGKERKIVEALVQAKAQVNAVNKDGVSALMVAASAGRDGYVRLLLQNDAKADLRDNDGWTALMWAADGGEWSAANELIEAKANVNAADKKGWTPMMMALVRGRGSVVEHLIKGGATMPAKAPDGSTAIILAAYGRDLSCIVQVLDNAQPFDGRDSDGWTALEIASYNGDGQIVMALLRRGLDPSLKDKEQKTAIDRARENDNPEIVALLGGPWNKPPRKGGTTIAIPCEALGGNAEANFAVEEKTLVISTTFPKPLTWYLGGEKAFTPAYEIEGYKIDYSQYGTSVPLRYKDSKGNVQSKNVYAHVLSADIEKGGEPVDTSSLAENAPRAVNDGGVLVTRIPLALLKLTPGKSIRVTSKIGACAAVVSKVKL